MPRIENRQGPSQQDADLEDRGYDYDDDTTPQYSDDEADVSPVIEIPSVPSGVEWDS